MNHMFRVRSSLPCPQSAVGSTPCTRCLRLPSQPRAACPTCAPSRMPSSRQLASAFNQPLSFDTSRVTTMYGMFYVRSSLCPAPDLQSSLILHAACTAAARRPPFCQSTPPTRVFMRSFRLSAQGTTAFNQPLSFDTSSVTTMDHMFNVRSSSCSARNLQPSLILQYAWDAVACCPPASRPASCPVQYALLLTWQDASAFSQPLSFDTSRVTTISGMFHVRSSLCPAPNLQSSPPLHAACTAAARRPPSANPHLPPVC